MELEDYVKAGIPCVHHSSEFRKMYQPHYRVVAQQHTNCYPVLRWIAGQGRKERCVIAIDGGCGSGKTTLAQQIAEVFDCGVVHMDDFFLPQDMRTKRRLSEPGGNVHYERVAEEVLEPLCRGEAVRYRQYDCAAGKMGDKRELPRKAFYIVEGAYALHPHLRPYYTDSIVLHIERALQEERIVTREGNMGAHMFFERWMPLEWRYFEECGVYKHAGAVFESGEDGRIKRFLKQ